MINHIQSTIPKIIIKRNGRLANNMFQVMLAYELKKRVPSAQIFGLSLPEWGIKFAYTELVQPVMKIQRHKFDLDLAAYLLKSGILGSVLIDGWGMRLSYFPDADFYRKIFITDAKAVEVSDKQILLNVRSEDIVTGKHPRYYPLPFSFYEKIIDTTAQQPVFMGQLDDSDYVLALRKKFSGAKFLPNNDPLVDFQTIRNARNVAISVSSFAWLASWLSETLESIHFPVAGLYDPLNLETLLMPVDDPRYHFYDLKFPSIEERKKVSAADWALKNNPVELMTQQESKLRVLSAFTPQ
jgi:hypothetical protein